MTSKLFIARTSTPRQRDDGAKDERFTDRNVHRALPRQHRGERGPCFDAEAVKLLGTI